MIKILYLCEHLKIGGAEQLLLTTLRYLDRDKFLPVVYCIGEKGEIGREIEGIGISVIALNKRPDLWNISIAYNLVRIFLKEKPDIVHTNLYLANGYGRISARLAGVDTIITSLHNPDYSYEDNGRWAYKVRKAIDKYSGRFCNSAFIAVSESVKKDFEKHLAFKNIKVVYNCIDVSLFARIDRTSISYKRKELGISDDEVVLLNIGRLHPQKGQLYLIEAFSLIQKKEQRYRLLIVGKGNLESILRKKAADLGLGGSVIFLKDRRDIPELMSAGDMFVFPSLYEGFGIALVEAMASGMPIIASDIEPFREVVRNGIDGVLVEKGNSDKLAEAIYSLSQNKERMAYFGKNAKERAAEMFDANPNIKNLENIYQQLAYDTSKKETKVKRQ